MLGFWRMKIESIPPWLWAGAIALIWLLLVLARYKQEPARFQTVDGFYYQWLADQFLEGKAMVLPELVNGKRHTFSPYPPGYPVLLGLISKISGLAYPLAAIFLHGIFFFLLVGFGWQMGLAPALVLMYFSDTALTLGANTWSEFAFLFFGCLLGMAWKSEAPDNSYGNAYLLAVLAIFAFFMRYAAFFWLPLFFLPLIKGKIKVWNSPAVAGLAFLILATFWFWSQWQATGLPTGGDRYPNQDSGFYLAKSLLKECLNQIFLFRNPDGSRPWWEVLGGIIQCGILIVFFQFNIRAIKLRRVLNHSFFFLGLGLLIGMVLTRWHFYFAESYDLRLLGPGFMLMGIGLFGKEIRLKAGRGEFSFILVWVAFSLIYFLPKNWLLEYLGF